MDDTALRHRIEGLRRERRIICFRGQSAVQFPGPLTEQPRFLRINSTNQFLNLSRRHAVTQIGLTRKHALIIAADRIEGELPRVTFICDRRLDEGQHHLAVVGAIFEHSGEGGYIWKSRPFSQESSDLDVGINPLFQFPEHLEEIFAVEKHGGVALFCAHYVRRRAQVFRVRKFRRSAADHLATCGA